jgi:hypothetical protein
MAAIPIIDPTVRHVGVSKLRELNATKLKENEETLVIQDNDTPLAVLLTYEKFLIIQEQLMAVFNTVELLSDDLERKGLVAAFEDIKNGRIRSLDEIEAELGEE